MQKPKMSPAEWEAVVEQILGETRLQKNDGGRNRVLKTWRAKLEAEPTSLSPHQIDLVVRKVRDRLVPPKRTAVGR